jgi:transcriptional regulator with XRE-family HTH domain
VEIVRRLRKERGWSQRELASAAGTTQYTISELEQGHREPHPKTLRKLADALGISVADFFVEEEQTDPKALTPSQDPHAATGSTVEEEGNAVALIAALRSYFWDLRFRWKEPGNKPTPAQIRDALDLLQHLVSRGAFEGLLTPREQSEVRLLFNAAHKLRPLAEELAEENEAPWLKDISEEVFERLEEISS